MKRSCNNCTYKGTNHKDIEYCNNKDLKNFLYSNIPKYQAKLIYTEDGKRITIEEITKTVGNPCNEWEFDGVSEIEE